jgi:hypothetical protein
MLSRLRPFLACLALLACIQFVAEALACKAEARGLSILEAHSCGGSSSEAPVSDATHCCHSDCNPIALNATVSLSEALVFHPILYHVENQLTPDSLARDVHQPPRLS